MNCTSRAACYAVRAAAGAAHARVAAAATVGPTRQRHRAPLRHSGSSGQQPASLPLPQVKVLLPCALAALAPHLASCSRAPGPTAAAAPSPGLEAAEAEPGATVVDWAEGTALPVQAAYVYMATKSKIQ